MVSLKDVSILVVEDEKELASVYKEVLEGAGAKVDTAEDGKIALERLDNKQYNLILLDLMMPEVDGLEVLKKVRADAKNDEIRIVILTNLSSEVVINESFRSKTDGYLMKTELTPQQIVLEVKKYLQLSKKKNAS